VCTCEYRAYLFVRLIQDWTLFTVIYWLTCVCVSLYVVWFPCLSFCPCLSVCLPTWWTSTDAGWSLLVLSSVCLPAPPCQSLTLAQPAAAWSLSVSHWSVFTTGINSPRPELINAHSWAPCVCLVRCLSAMHRSHRPMEFVSSGIWLWVVKCLAEVCAGFGDGQKTEPSQTETAFFSQNLIQGETITSLYISMYLVKSTVMQCAYNIIEWCSGKVELSLKCISILDFHCALHLWTLSTFLLYLLYVLFAWMHVWCIAGIAYVTFSKASEAALAIENMNGHSIKDNSRPVKVCYLLLISTSICLRGCQLSYVIWCNIQGAPKKFTPWVFTDIFSETADNF